DVDAREADAMARRHARGRFFVCAMIGEGEPDQPTRAAYKSLGYRLLATEGFFVQRLRRVPKSPSSMAIERVRTPELAARLGKMTRTRPIASDLLAGDAIPPVCGARSRGNRRPRAERGCGGRNVVRGHVRHSIAPASWDRASAVVPNVAGRPRPRLEVL